MSKIAAAQTQQTPFEGNNGMPLVGRLVYEVVGPSANGHAQGVNSHFRFETMPPDERGSFEGKPWVSVPPSVPAIADYTGMLFANPQPSFWGSLEIIPEASPLHTRYTGHQYCLRFSEGVFRVYRISSQIETAYFLQALKEDGNHTLREGWIYTAGDFGSIESIFAMFTHFEGRTWEGPKGLFRQGPWNYAEKANVLQIEIETRTEIIKRLIEQIGLSQPDQVTGLEWKAYDLNRMCKDMKGLQDLEALLEKDLPAGEFSQAE